jgi:hypothetical protein
MGVSTEEVYDYLISRSSIFGVMPDTDTIFFRHRTFAEYLYALDAYERRNLQVDARALHPYWVNVFFFYVGLLAECPETLDELSRIAPDTESARWVRVLHFGNYLLAGYQSPYSAIESSLYVLFVEFSRLYLDAKSLKLKAKLGQLSEMRLLWMFAMLAKNSCGYEFFQRAIPLAMAQLDEAEELTKEEKVYALFFAACALGELDDPCGYSFLLGRHKTEALPVAVSLALKCEIDFSEKNFSKDPVIRRHEKMLLKVLGGRDENSLSVRRGLDDIFEKPLLALKPRAPGAN